MTPEQRDEAATMFVRGARPAKIAQRLGCDIDAVYIELRRRRADRSEAEGGRASSERSAGMGCRASSSRHCRH
jgi:hypothetical protein